MNDEISFPVAGKADLYNPLGNRAHWRKMLAILYKKRKIKAKIVKSLERVNAEIGSLLRYEE